MSPCEVCPHAPHPPISRPGRPSALVKFRNVLLTESKLDTPLLVAIQSCPWSSSITQLRALPASPSRLVKDLTSPVLGSNRFRPFCVLSHNTPSRETCMEFTSLLLSCSAVSVVFLYVVNLAVRGSNRWRPKLEVPSQMSLSGPSTIAKYCNSRLLGSARKTVNRSVAASKRFKPSHVATHKVPF